MAPCQSPDRPSACASSSLSSKSSAGGALLVGVGVSTGVGVVGEDGTSVGVGIGVAAVDGVTSGVEIGVGVGIVVAAIGVGVSTGVGDIVGRWRGVSWVTGVGCSVPDCATCAPDNMRKMA